MKVVRVRVPPLPVARLWWRWPSSDWNFLTPLCYTNNVHVSLRCTFSAFQFWRAVLKNKSVNVQSVGTAVEPDQWDGLEEDKNQVTWPLETITMLFVVWMPPSPNVCQWSVSVKIEFCWGVAQFPGISGLILTVHFAKWPLAIDIDLNARVKRGNDWMLKWKRWNAKNLLTSFTFCFLMPCISETIE